MIKPVVVEKFADNGALSHYEVVDAVSGETLWEDPTPHNFQKERADKVACACDCCASNNSEITSGCYHGKKQLEICHGYIPRSSPVVPTEDS